VSTATAGRGATHELVSDLRPLVLVRVHGGAIALAAATEVSVSVVDRPRGGGWARQPAGRPGGGR